MIKVGDLVSTRCFGPLGQVGEIGVVAARSTKVPGLWWVLFEEEMSEIAADGLEVIHECRRPSQVQAAY